MNNHRKGIYLYSETIRQFFDAESGTMKYALYLYKCPVCGKQCSDTYLIHFNFNYVKCRNCGFVYANPRLNDEGSKIWYNSDFYNAALNSECYRVKQGEIYYSSSLSLDKMEYIAKCLLKYSSKDSYLLDLGCGIGSFLHLLKDKYGFTNLKGIELNEFAVNFARQHRGLDVILGDAAKFADRNQFDVVLSLEIIEHMNDLNSYGNAIWNLLKPGGLLLLTTPYNDQKTAWLTGIFGDHYMAPNHVNFFNKKTITLFLERYGFTVIDFHFWKNSIGPRMIKARMLYKRDWATADPPLIISHGVVYPKSYEGDIRNFIEIINQSEIQSRNEALDNKGLKIVKRLKQIINQILSFDSICHMLIVAIKI